MLSYPLPQSGGCSLFEFNIIASNDVGNSTTESIIETVPISKLGPKGHNFIGLVVTGSPNGVWQGEIHRVITVVCKLGQFSMNLFMYLSRQLCPSCL